jgi:hypothetical protein
MNYSREDILDLIRYLDSFGDTYFVLKCFFEETEKEAPFDLTEPPNSFRAAIVLEDLKTLFPDTYHALKMPEKELPMYLNSSIGQEYPIACWRLKR